VCENRNVNAIGHTLGRHSDSQDGLASAAEATPLETARAEGNKLVLHHKSKYSSG
jgi:hypothetical protein